jgi:hypothetical protein
MRSNKVALSEFNPSRRIKIFVYCEMETPLLYADSLCTQELINVENAVPGIYCNCTCPKCHKTLIAKNQGPIRLHHFAHLGPPCENAGETAFHKFCKQIIFKSRWVRLASGELFTYTRAVIEESVGERDIDVMICNDQTGRKLAVEIKYTNALKEDKIQFLKQEGYAILEIDVSDYDRAMDPLELTDLVLDESINKEDFPLIPALLPSSTITSNITGIDWGSIFLFAAFIAFIFICLQKLLSPKKSYKHKPALW